MTQEEKIEKILYKNQALPYYRSFSWTEHSWAVAEYCPHLIDTNLYNWTEFSPSIVKFCPQKFDTNKYDWKSSSDAVAKYCPDLIDLDKFNWTLNSKDLLRYHPTHKYLKHSVWEKGTINALKYADKKGNLKLLNPELEKYKDLLYDLIDPSKKEALLERITKGITLNKI